MKKYLYIYKSELMTNLNYYLDILMDFVGYAIVLIIFINLWQYIYSDTNELINGYDLNQMIYYVSITEILWSTIKSRKVCRRISDDVKSGNIAYNINKPYSYIGYILSSYLGEATIRGILYLILGILLGYVSLGYVPHLTLGAFIVFIISMILAVVVSILLVTCIGLISFFIEDANPLYWVYSKFILVIGTIFPVEFFPLWAQPIIKYSPISALCYGPAKLFVDFSYTNAINVLISQVAYIFISYVLAALIYKKGVKNINVNGG